MLSDQELKKIRADWRNRYAAPVADPYEDIPRLLDEIARLNKVIFDWSDDLAAKGWDGDYDSLQKHSEEQQEEIDRLRAQVEALTGQSKSTTRPPSRTDAGEPSA